MDNNLLFHSGESRDDLPEDNPYLICPPFARERTTLVSSVHDPSGIWRALTVLEKPDERRDVTQFGSPILQFAKRLQPLGVGGNQIGEIQYERPLEALAQVVKFPDVGCRESASYRHERHVVFNPPRLDPNSHTYEHSAMSVPACRMANRLA